MEEGKEKKKGKSRKIEESITTPHAFPVLVSSNY